MIISKIFPALFLSLGEIGRDFFYFYFIFLILFLF